MENKNSWGLGNFIAIIILGAILIIGGSLLGSYVSNQHAANTVAGVQSIQPQVEKTISYAGQDGKTALDILKASHTIKTQDSSIGVFVISIDETSNTDTEYWMFYVNDQLAPVGADQYQTKDTDKIDWRFEKLQ